MDLYALYRGENAPQAPASFVKSITTMNVEKVLDPEEWLPCIRWARYRQVGNDASMEWFIARPTNSMFYYSLGEDGSLLVPRENNMEMIQINAETVKAIAGVSSMFCKNPTIIRVDKKEVCESL